MRTAVRFPARTSLEQILAGLAADTAFQEMVTRWERLPARPARYAPFPEWLDGRIAGVVPSTGRRTGCSIPRPIVCRFGNAAAMPCRRMRTLIRTATS